MTAKATEKLGMSAAAQRRSGQPEVRVASVYGRIVPADGTRVLVDRTWPRGVPKAGASIADWFPGVAPSAPLRFNFSSGSVTFAECRRHYLDELREPLRALAMACLGQLARHRRVVLLTADDDTQHSPAAVVAEQLRSGSVGVPPLPAV